MKLEDRQKLRELALAARSGPPDSGKWMLQSSNSFRRIGTQQYDGGVLCGTTHPRDGHPDLSAPAGVLDYVVAAQPSVVLELLDYINANCTIEENRKQFFVGRVAISLTETEQTRVREKAELLGMSLEKLLDQTVGSCRDPAEISARIADLAKGKFA